MNKKQHLHRARILATECIRAPAMASTLFNWEAFDAAVYFFLFVCFDEEEPFTDECDEGRETAFAVLLRELCDDERDAVVCASFVEE